MARGSILVDKFGGLNVVKRTANLPTVNNWSACGWANLTGIPPGGARTFIWLYDSATSKWVYAGITVSGSVHLQRLHIVEASNNSVLANAVDYVLADDTWYFWGLSVGAGANAVTLRTWDAAGVLLDTAVSNFTLDVTGFTPTKLEAFCQEDFTSGVVQGYGAQVRVYDAVLTQAEFETELASSSPVRTANLNTAWEDDPTVDVSGNGRAWTTSGTDAIADIYPPNYDGVMVEGVERWVDLYMGPVA